ncbi:MAG TPA: hypothetical protein PKO41_09220 [Dokdonella sp.]|uniref:hypothetical protein n=1 Tax=Dokdonella sp. TaxID=2291710 RepID=UPI0025BE89DE|nr:hypothetical protein [Dokdonella sp.]MBX3693390.1 hypothetical protein [Dokdonella sp.]MCW5569120.1 hypothetical protein [Dokdonella sp.]HNR92591.1 hypothetical protein [Dokdonella sp.]
MNRIDALKFAMVVLAAWLVSGCHTMTRPDAAASLPTGDPRAALVGDYDNHEQVSNAAAQAPPAVAFRVDPLPREGWLAWRTHLRSATTLEATWLLRVDAGADGGLVVVPHRPLVADAPTDKRFDAAQWVALDACALRGTRTAAGFEARADAAACATIAPGIGVEAALLPLAIEHAGEWLRVRLFADQARGENARAEARRVQWFVGWGAINGAGDKATADSTDWHMNKDLRIGNEGGRAALNWRDGRPSGWSLRLERLTYRDGNMPVLRLSLIEDAGNHVLAYAWANPDATSIGLNLGWVQIGLTREAAGKR